MIFFTAGYFVSSGDILKTVEFASVTLLPHWCVKNHNLDEWNVKAITDLLRGFVNINMWQSYQYEEWWHQFIDKQILIDGCQRSALSASTCWLIERLAYMLDLVWHGRQVLRGSLPSSKLLLRLELAILTIPLLGSLLLEIRLLCVQDPPILPNVSVVDKASNRNYSFTSFVSP